MSAVVAVRSVEIGISNLERSTQFYRDVWALDLVAEAGGKRYFRASGPDHHVLVIREAATAGILGIELALESVDAVRELHARSAPHAAEIEEPAAHTAPGGGFGFSMRDACGRHWTLTAGADVHGDVRTLADRPYKLSHVVLNSPEVAAEAAQAMSAFGFRLRDESKSMLFLGCNADHHSLAFARGAGRSLNHIAFEVPSIDAVMRNAGRLKKDGFPLQWGVGRHGPGANVYSYFLDPDDLPIEYTAELMQVDDATYQAGTPADWERPAFFDAWGLADPPTKRFLDASSGALSIPPTAHVFS